MLYYRVFINFVLIILNYFCLFKLLISLVLLARLPLHSLPTLAFCLLFLLWSIFAWYLNIITQSHIYSILIDHFEHIEKNVMISR